MSDLHPDEDLVERAETRPRRPGPEPRPGAKLATIVFSLLLPLVIIFGALALIRSRTGAPAGEGPGVAPTPANGELLYAKRVNETWNLFAFDPVTGAERQITHDDRDYASSWSPDSTKIAYDNESSSGAEEIWVANADGSDPVRLNQDGSFPSWSPDGSQIAFARPDLSKMVQVLGGKQTPLYIYVMNADGSNVRRLTRGAYTDYWPRWSPDGTEIVFVRSGTQGTALMVMDADGSDQRQIGGPGLDITSAPAWSPDGTSIALALNGTPDGGPGGIVLVPSDGNGSQTLVPGVRTDFPDYVSNPAWSPDGKWLAYVRQGGEQIVIVHPDGTGERALQVYPGTDTIEELSWGVAAPGSSSP